MFQLSQTLLCKSVPLTPLPPGSRIFQPVSDELAEHEFSFFVHLNKEGRPVNIHHQDWLQYVQGTRWTLLCVCNVAFSLLCVHVSSDGKKMINHIDRGSKTLTFGTPPGPPLHVVKLSSFGAVAQCYPAHEHGLRSTDYQANRNRQSVPILEHLTSDVRRALPRPDCKSVVSCVPRSIAICSCRRCGSAWDSLVRQSRSILGPWHLSH